MSDFKAKVEEFFSKIGTDLKDDEKAVVAWFHHFYNKHKDGQTPAAPDQQAGATRTAPDPHPQTAPLPPTPTAMNPPAHPSAGGQAGSGAKIWAPTMADFVTPAGLDPKSAYGSGEWVFIADYHKVNFDPSSPDYAFIEGNSIAAENKSHNLDAGFIPETAQAATWNMALNRWTIQGAAIESFEGKGVYVASTSHSQSEAALVAYLNTLKNTPGKSSGPFVPGQPQ